MALPKPDPQRYRGGSTSRLYKEDLAAWEASQQDTKLRPQIEPVGRVIPISLASSFDEEPDPFAPEPVVEFGPGSGYRGEPEVEPVVTATGYREPGDVTSGPNVEPEETRYGSLEEALQAAQEVYSSSFLEQQQKNVDSAFDALSEKDKKNLERYEASIDRSSRDARGVEKNHPEAYAYIMQKRGLETGVQGVDFDSLMFDKKTMGRKRENVDYYDEDSPYRLGAEAQADVVKDYLEQEGIPLYKELEDGSRLYLNTGTSAHFDMSEFGAGEGKWLSAGPVGTYSTYWEPKPELSFLEGMIANPIFRTALAAATGGASEFYIQTGRALSGETLNAGDWVSVVIGGLQQTGVIKPPVDIGGDIVNPIGGGTLGSQMADNLLMGFDGALSSTEMLEGVGLFGLDYGTTVGVIQAIGNEDPAKLVTSLVSKDTLSNVLEDTGLPTDIATDPDVIEGVKEGLTTVLNGGDLQEGLQSGLIEYITEGGSFGDAPDIDLGVVEDVLKPIVDPLLTVVETAGEAIEDVAKPIIDPVITAAETVGTTVEDIAKPSVDPVITAIEEVAPVVEDVVRDVGSAIDDAVIEPVKEAVESIETPELPDIDLPDVDLPSIDLPSINLPSINLGLNLQAPRVTMPSSTRTTDGLFNKELFKFQTELGVSPEAPLIQAPTRRSAQVQQQQQQPREQYVNLFNDPFDNPFARKV